MMMTCCFQKDNVANQHEHIVHLLANEQSRLRIPDEAEPVSFLFFIFKFEGFIHCTVVLKNMGDGPGNFVSHG